MFNDLKPYVHYGVAPGSWLPPMPQHWHVVPGSRVLTLVSMRNAGLLESTVLSLSYGKVIVRPPEKLRGLVPKSFEGYQILEPGDIVIRPTDLQNDKTSLRVGHVRQRGIITSAYLGFRVVGAHDAFVVSYLAALDQMKIFYSMGSGLRQSLDFSDFKRLPVAVPLPDEQAAIVKYLGHAHARIDRAIAAKRKLVALLEEQRQVFNHQAVTCGLDPSAPLKDSGVPWLGRIPSDWTVRKLFSLFHQQGSGTTPADEEHYNGDIPWIMSGDLNNGSISRARRSVTKEAVTQLTSLRVYEPGSLVIAMYGATIGKTGMTTMRAATNQACCVFARPRKDVCTRYVQLAMGVGRPALIDLGVGGGQPNVNASTVRQFRLPTPPLNEQHRIVHACLAEENHVSRLKSQAFREIELLREFRARLTSDVVTGQVDVRAIAATLPELNEQAFVDIAEDLGDEEEPVESALEFVGADE